MAIFKCYMTPLCQYPLCDKIFYAIIHSVHWNTSSTQANHVKIFVVLYKELLSYPVFIYVISFVQSSIESPQLSPLSLSIHFQRAASYPCLSREQCRLVESPTWVRTLTTSPSNASCRRLLRLDCHLSLIWAPGRSPISVAMVTVLV